jgi:hypothetical protein
MTPKSQTTDGGRMKRAIALSALILLAAIATKAQTPTQQQLQQALASNNAFFDSKQNQVLSQCSNEGWRLIRQENELITLSRQGTHSTASDVTIQENLIDECRKQAAKAYDDVFNTLVMLLKSSNSQSDNLSHLILEQLRYIETLRYFQELTDGASAKVLRDHLFDTNQQVQHRYDGLVDRYNSLVDRLASAPLPANYQRPTRLRCESTSNHLGEWSTVTTVCE